MSPAQYAALRSVSRQAVMRRIAAGSLPTSARKVGRLWQIDAEKATEEWEGHTRPRVDARHSAARQSRMYRCYVASCKLVYLAARVEECHEQILAEFLKHAPDYQTTAWPTLAQTWAEMPDVLEELQGAIYAAEKKV